MGEYKTILAKLDQILARVVSIENALPLSARPGPGGGNGAGTMGPVGQRRQAKEAMEAQWLPVKERWPKWSIHPQAIEAYERHCKTLEGEPTIERVQKAVSKLEFGQYYRRDNLEHMFSLSTEKAQAIQYFMKVGGFIDYVAGRGFVRVPDQNTPLGT